MKSIAVVIGAVAAGYIAHKLVGKHVDPMFSKAHEALKSAVKRGKAEAEAPAAEAAAE